MVNFSSYTHETRKNEDLVIWKAQIESKCSVCICGILVLNSRWLVICYSEQIILFFAFVLKKDADSLKTKQFRKVMFGLAHNLSVGSSTHEIHAEINSFLDFIFNLLFRHLQ